MTETEQDYRLTPCISYNIAIRVVWSLDTSLNFMYLVVIGLIYDPV